MKLLNVFAMACVIASPALAVDMVKAPLLNSKGMGIGEVQIAADPKGGVTLQLKAGLPAGEHGFHLHETGKCEIADFKSAGGHWNPDGKEHGFLHPSGHHGGDLPNLVVPASGKLTKSFSLPAVTLPALLDQDGFAVIVHEKADDYLSAPAGEAGNRIACAAFNP
jgi:Cu-Zn family superoxide dismutase